MIRLLLIEDDADTAELLARSLGRRGYDVERRSSGAEALELAIKWQPRVALVDISLPDIDGLNLIEELRQVCDDVQCIAMSGYGDEATRQRVEQAGFVDFFVKPFKLSDVGSRLEALTQPA